MQVNAEDFNPLRHKSYLQHVKIQFIRHRKQSVSPRQRPSG